MGLGFGAGRAWEEADGRGTPFLRNPLLWLRCRFWGEGLVSECGLIGGGGGGVQLCLREGMLRRWGGRG